MIKGKMKYIKSIHVLIAFIIVVILFMEVSAVSQKSKMADAKCRIDYSYEDMPLTPKQVSKNLKTMKKSKAWKYTFWGDAGYKSVKVEGLDSISNQKIIYFCGNSKNIVKSDTELFIDDINCCILGKKTAFELSGTLNVKGLKIQINGSEYTVLDVAKDVDEGIFAEVNENSKEASEPVLKYGTAYKKYAASLEEGTQADMNRFSMEKNRYAYERLYFCADSLIKLVILIQLILLIIFIYKRKKLQLSNCGWNNKIFAMLIVILSVITFKNITILRDFLPTQWSDFNFFKELVWQEIATWKHFELTNKLDNQYQIMEAFKSCIQDLKSVCLMMLTLIGIKIIGK